MLTPSQELRRLWNQRRSICPEVAFRSQGGRETRRLRVRREWLGEEDAKFLTAETIQLRREGSGGKEEGGQDEREM